MITKDIPCWPGYQCDELGNIYSTRLGPMKQMKLKTSTRGYLCVQLYRPDKKQHCLVHRLILTTWVRHPKDGEEVNHKNGIKSDNKVDNLEWVTRVENERHSHAVLGKDMRGPRHPLAKLTSFQAKRLRQLRADGWVLTRLAKEFGIGTTTVTRVLSGVRYIEST